MQSAMNRLSAFVRTRRKLVLVVWLVLLVVSIPLASQQTKHLTSGGFEVPGTRLGRGRPADRPLHRAEGETLGVVLEGKGGEQLVAAVDRVGAAAKAHRPRRARARGRAGRQAGRRAAGRRRRPARRRRQSSTTSCRPPRTCARSSRSTRSSDGVQAYVVGQQALWAGMQQLQQEDLEKAETTRLPGDPDRAAGGLRHRARRAAARPRSAIAAVVVTGAIIYLLSARDDDVGVRHEHHLDARHRRGGRLLACSCSAATARSCRPARTARRRWTPRCAPPARPSSSPASP